jgi:hypothetical protein
MGAKEKKHAIAMISGGFALILVLVGSACTGDAATGTSCPIGQQPVLPDYLPCDVNGGACVDLGTSEFTGTAFLLWIGDEKDAPECPEHAPIVDYIAYSDLSVDVQCGECKCSAPTCILPNAIGVDTLNSCASGVIDNYAVPVEWDGSCYAAGSLPAGSFASFAFPLATAIGGTPSSTAITADVHWGKLAKACYGKAEGYCENAGQICSPRGAPDFRHCVRYEYGVDESDLPQCPAAFPEQHVFYKEWAGKGECTPCECSQPEGAQCIAAFSLYQDATCSDVPAPLVKNALGGTCVQAMQAPLGAISAKWITNNPGKSVPSGGEPVGGVKPVDPRVFCCKPPPPFDAGPDGSKE